MLKDRRHRPVVTHRISCGRVSGEGRDTRVEKLDFLELTTMERDRGAAYPVDYNAMNALAKEPFGARYVFKTEEVEFDGPKDDEGKPTKVKKKRVIGARRIPIRVDSDDIADFLIQDYESTKSLPIPDRNGGFEARRRPAVWCRGDGETATRLGPDNKTWSKIRCCASPSHQARDLRALRQVLEATHDPTDGFRCPYAQNVDNAFPRCGPVTTLMCRSDVVSNGGAFCRYRSHAHSSADQIMESLVAIKKLTPGGILRHVPLDLVLEMKLLPRPGGGSALQPVCHIELRLTPEDTSRLLEANLRQEMNALGAVSEQRRLLAAARIEVEAEIDDGEFGKGSGVANEQKPSGALDVLVKP